MTEPYREPVSTVLNVYGEVMVICSDGSVWLRRETEDWREGTPIPGSRWEDEKAKEERENRPGQAPDFQSTDIPNQGEMQ